eukprot:TRINITY_DN29859_c0_g1_i1.p1 TRINITY_DN29859_c0_g1~~TRINITY_DN29859_c0_g1_i1.p1  ORF type:complete len:1055 (+),score=229.04 TRINITY_DN29859_c0_g1_i1:171-3335(+)
MWIAYLLLAISSPTIQSFAENAAAGGTRPGGRERERDEDWAARRLDEATLRRRLTVEPTGADWLHERGQLPALTLGALRLREVVTYHRRTPWKLRHAIISDDPAIEEQQTRLRSERRLSSAVSDMVADLPTQARTPQELVRLLVGLNAAATPSSMYSDPRGKRSFLKEWGRTVYQDGEEAFAPYGLDDGAAGRDDAVILQIFEREVEELLEARQAIRGKAGSAWQYDKFQGFRLPPCSAVDDATQNAERCIDDVGVAISLYEDATSKIIVFQGSHQFDTDYVTWCDEVSILELMEKQIMEQWEQTAHKEVTAEMFARRGTHIDELNHRCAFAAEARSIYPDGVEANLTQLAQEAGGDSPDATASSQMKAGVDQDGLWYLTKKMVRILMPYGRNIATERQKTLLFTGSGLGGTHAALTALWLQTVEAMVYPTYVFAPHGFQCMARRRYKSQTTPWSYHPNIRVYHHAFDVYAGLGRVSGEVCTYGAVNMTDSTPLYQYCERIVGHTGPQLLYKGQVPNPGREYSSVGDKYDEYLSSVAAAARSFKACAYFTHSIWFSALLLANDSILDLMGVPDGGCTYVHGVPQVDNLHQCPSSSRAAQDCAYDLSDKRGIDYAAIVSVNSVLLGFIVCNFVLFFMCLQSVRGDSWVYGKETLPIGKEIERALDDILPRGLNKWLRIRCKWCFPARKVSKAQQLDRARAARERKKAREAERVEKRKQREEDKKGGAFGVGFGKKVKFVAVEESDEDEGEENNKDVESQQRLLPEASSNTTKGSKDQKEPSMDELPPPLPLPPPKIDAREALLKNACTGASLDKSVIVTIQRAIGLRNADWVGTSDPVCVCFIQDKDESRIVTPVISDNCNPVWAHREHLRGFREGDVVEFSVFDSDPTLFETKPEDGDFLGRLILAGSAFWPHGLPLTQYTLEESETGGQATLEIQVELVPRIGAGVASSSSSNPAPAAVSTAAAAVEGPGEDSKPSSLPAPRPAPPKAALASKATASANKVETSEEVAAAPAGRLSIDRPGIIEQTPSGRSKQTVQQERMVIGRMQSIHYVVD